MPNRTIEPHGKLIPSATFFSRTSRDSTAEACTLAPASSVMKRATVAPAGRIFMPARSDGPTIFFLVEWNVPGSCTKARQNFTSDISLGAYLRYQESSAALPSFLLASRHGSSPAAIHGKRPGAYPGLAS